jgi:hypothetical protein
MIWRNVSFLYANTDFNLKYFIPKSFWVKFGYRRNNCDVSGTLSGMSEWYVCIYTEMLNFLIQISLFSLKHVYTYMKVQIHYKLHSKDYQDNSVFYVSRIYNGQWIVKLIEAQNHHHHQPINVPTAGAQAFLMDYT